MNYTDWGQQSIFLCRLFTFNLYILLAFSPWHLRLTDKLGHRFFEGGRESCCGHWVSVFATRVSSLSAALHSIMVSISLKVTVGNNSPFSQASFPQIQVKHSTGNDTSEAFKKWWGQAERSGGKSGERVVTRQQRGGLAGEPVSWHADMFIKPQVTSLNHCIGRPERLVSGIKHRPHYYGTCFGRMSVNTLYLICSVQFLPNAGVWTLIKRSEI